MNATDTLRRRWRLLRRDTRTGLERSGEELDQLWQRLRGRHVRIGITGFSGAGKTTLIASLIHQLRHPEGHRQSRFQPILQGRLLGAEIHPLPDATPLFPYHPGIARLAAEPPQWPESTRSLSGCLLELQLKGRRGRGRSFTVELRDYPGEWLLDLPLLEQSYEAWCRETLALLKRSPRAEACAGFLHKSSEITSNQAIDEHSFHELAALYRRGLEACRQRGLTLVQPGRALVGDWQPFVPLPPISEPVVADSVYDRSRRAYDHYIRDQVRPFFHEHFARLDRQLLLVDLLGLLQRGPTALEDFRYALARVLAAFSYGPESLLRRLLTPRIDRLVIAATKTDQIRQDQWENLRDLLAVVVREASRRAEFKGADLWLDTCSAVRAVYPADIKGEPGLVATLADGRSGVLDHPPIPRDLPDAEEWQALAQWPPLALQPQPAPQLSQGGELANYRVDALLRELLGDWMH